MDQCGTVTRIPSQRGRNIIVVDGYSFSFHKDLRKHTAEPAERWSCSNRSCRAFIHTTKKGLEILFSKLDHNHQATTKVARQKLRGKLRDVTKENLFEQPNTILNRELKENDYEVDNSDIRSVKRSMYYTRKKLILTISEDIQEVQALSDETEVQTNTSEKILIKTEAPENLNTATSHEIDETSTATNTVHVNTPDHYSNQQPACQLKEAEEDECDLYGKMVAKKLRKIPESERELIMYEIDGIFVNRNKNVSNTNSKKRRTFRC